MTDQPAGNGNSGLDGAPTPAGVDLTLPSIARVYDFVLGGKDHYAIDRQVSEALFIAVPEARQIALDNRKFLQRAVRYLVSDAGIRQFVDIGSGLPTLGNVHEIAHEIDPTVHVVYVDIDPIVLAHGRALISDEGTTAVVSGDIRDVDAILADPTVLELIDLDEPVAVIAGGILHHLSDAEDPYAVAARLRERISTGSYLVVSNFLDDDEQRAKDMERAMLEGGLGTGRFRTWDEHRRFFEGLEMVEPGLEYANDWRPDDQTPTASPVHTLYAGGIGRKPA